MDTLESGQPGDSGRAGAGRRWAAYAVVVTLAVVAGFLLGRSHQTSTRGAVEPRTSQRLTDSLAPAAAGPLRTHHYRLLTRGRDIEVAVDLVETTAPGAETVRVAVIGHISDGRPHAAYRLVGGRCPSQGSTRREWAAGRTDKEGDAILRGQPALLMAEAAYWLVVKPWPRNVYYFRSPPGLEGLWQTRSVFTFPAGEPGC
jgi:hypothetical protein